MLFGLINVESRHVHFYLSIVCDCHGGGLTTGYADHYFVKEAAGDPAWCGLVGCGS